MATRPHPPLMRLYTFCVAARHQSFKAAAEELFITASAVSHRIKDLEAQLGVDLFERKTRHVVLTSSGRALLNAIDPLLDALRNTYSRFTSNSGRRMLRVVATPFFASEMLIPRLREFKDLHPSIDIRIDTNQDPEPRHRADSDLSVLTMRYPPPGVRAVELFSLRFVPVCSPHYAELHDTSSAEALSAGTLLVHKRRPEAWREWFDHVGIARSPERLIELDTMFAVARAAEIGLGIGLLPMPLSCAWLESGALIPVHEAMLHTDDKYIAIFRGADAERPEIRALVDWTRETFGSDA